MAKPTKSKTTNGKRTKTKKKTKKKIIIKNEQKKEIGPLFSAITGASGAKPT